MTRLFCGCESSQFRVLFLPSRCFRAFWVPRDRIYPGEDIARGGGTQRATAYLVVAKVFVAAVVGYRAYEQLAGCNEKVVAAVGVSVSSVALIQTSTLREAENAAYASSPRFPREQAVSVSVSLGWQSNITLQPWMTPRVGTCCLISSYRS